MAYWNSNDREESKPTWLNAAQKINCVRTVRGWQLPLDGTSLGGQLHGKLGTTASIPAMELLVALPNDAVYNPYLLLTVTGRASNLAVNAAGGTGYTAGTTILCYMPGNYPIASTGSNVFAGTIAGSTAAAGTVTLQVTPIIPSNYTTLDESIQVEVKANGLVHPLGYTGPTAQIQTATFVEDYTTNSLYIARGVTSAVGGTGSSDLPEYSPYFTCPFTGDSATAGGIDSAGLSFTVSGTGSGGAYGNYAVNAYGVSTLNFPASATAYIKVVANDTNFTNNLTFSEVTDQFGARGNIVQGANLLTASNVPTAIYETFFGPTSAFNNNIAVFKIDRAGTTAGSYNVTLRVTDTSATPKTADTTFKVAFV
jgi:hypothetical protein